MNFERRNKYHHGQLWLSAKVSQNGSFTILADARNMIETVFSENEVLPDALAKNAMKAEGQELSEASMAQQNTLKIGGGYQRGEIDWWNEAKKPPRFGEETTEIMLAKWADGSLQRWAEGAWPYSMVKLASRQLDGDRIDASLNEQQKIAYGRLQQTLPSQGKWSVLLTLSQRADGVWQGRGWTAAEEKAEKEPKVIPWFYNENFGLREAESQQGETIE